MTCPSFASGAHAVERDGQFASHTRGGFGLGVWRVRTWCASILVLLLVASGCTVRLGGAGGRGPKAGAPAAGQYGGSSAQAGSGDDGARDSGTAPGVAGSGNAGTAGNADVGVSGTSGSGTSGAGASAGPKGPWQNVTGSLAGLPSECGNMTLVSVRPDRDMLMGGVAQQGLWASAAADDSSWRRLGQGAGSATITNRPSMILYDPDHADTFWEAGIYNGGGVYKTENNGQTFVQLGSIGHNDGVSVDFTDPARKTLLAGPHEQANKLYRSIDGGQNWMDIGSRLPMDTGALSSPLVIDAKVHLIGSYNGPGAGVFRTADGGNTWSQVHAGAVRGHPLVANNGSIYWLLDADAGLIRSENQGASWTQITDGKILATYGGGATVLELPDGRLISIGFHTIMISADQAATWRALGPELPFGPAGLAYSSFRNMLYVWHFDCNFSGSDPVLSDAIMALAFDYRMQ